MLCDAHLTVLRTYGCVALTVHTICILKTVLNTMGGGIAPLQISQPCWFGRRQAKPLQVKKSLCSFKQPAARRTKFLNSLNMVQSEFINNYSTNLLSAPCGENHLSKPLISNLRILSVLLPNPTQKAVKIHLKPVLVPSSTTVFDGGFLKFSLVITDLLISHLNVFKTNICTYIYLYIYLHLILYYPSNR